MQSNLDQVKNVLERRLEVLTVELKKAKDHLCSAPAAIHAGSDGDVGEVDSGASANTGILAFWGRQISEVTDTLRRIDQGEYGRCAVCEKPIDPKRLMAIPATTMCIGCQRDEERLRSRAYSMKEVLDSMELGPDNE